MTSETARILVCDLCRSTDAATVLEYCGQAMTSDSRVVSLPLKKVQCGRCGLVRNRYELSESYLHEHYGKEYQLGARAAGGEPMVHTETGTLRRSQIIADWIVRCAEMAGLNPSGRLLEVGCGEGSLLKELATRWPKMETFGIEPNEASVVAANQQELNVSQGTYREVKGSFDVIVSVAVVEHVLSPRSFICSLAEHLAEGGMMIQIQPCQDVMSHDIFFVDHLFHFHSSHLESYARQLDLDEVVREVEDGYSDIMSLHVFRRRTTEAPDHIAEPEWPAGFRIEPMIQSWQRRFDRMNDWLRGNGSRPVVVWGLGEIFQLFSVYSRLGDEKISIGIDDNTARFQAGAFDFPVVPFREELLSKYGDARWVTTFKPRKSVLQRLRDARIDLLIAVSDEPR